MLLPPIAYWFQYANEFNHCGVLINPFPNKPWFLRACSRGLLKTVWEKEKLLVTRAISPFPRCFLFGEPSAIFIKF